jgi:hypothetical protein
MIKLVLSMAFIAALAFSGPCRADEWRVPKQPWTYGGLKAPLIDHTLWKNWDRNAKYHFVGGFLTGLIFGAGQSAGQDFFKKIGGMTINEVVDDLDRFYREHPDDGATIYSLILKVIPQNQAQN